MIYLDNNADTFPDGLQGTPFWEVYRALRQVAVAGAWPVDPGAYRAGMAWGWYALHKPEYLTNFRKIVQAALISAQAPMIKATQTNAELVEYLRQWREYRPTFPQLQSLYSLFGAVVDIQPISDPESQTVLPVDNTRLAFYLRVESVDPERPLSLSDAITIAVRATPMGSRPYAYYVQESRVTVPVALAPAGVTLWVENNTVASDPPPLPVYGIPMGGMMSPTDHSTYYVQELPEQMTVDNIGLHGMVGPMGGMMTEYVPLTIITLYMVQSNKDCQIAVTNTSTPESRYCYQLYTSNVVQTSSTQFTPDLTKEYIYGYYDSQTGEWQDSSSKHNVSDMPSITGSSTMLVQILNDGKLWLGSNISVGSVTFKDFSVALFRVV